MDPLNSDKDASISMHTNHLFQAGKMANTTQQAQDALVKPWMDQNLPQRHPVFRTDGFSSQRAVVSNDKRKRADDVTDDFCKIIQQYERTTSGRGPAASIDIRGAHSWDQVVRAAKDAEAAYLAGAKKGAKGPVRRFFRQVGDRASMLGLWVGLLPSDQYFSVLCGSLKLVLEVAGKRSERRIMIFETFETLASVVEEVQRSYEECPGNVELRDRALAVYLDVLAMTEAMIIALMDKGTVDRIKDVLFRGPLADHDVDDKQKRLAKSMADLKDYAEYLHRASAKEANASIAVMVPSVHHTEQMVTSIHDTTQAILDYEQFREKLTAQATDSVHSILMDIVAKQNWLIQAQVKHAADHQITDHGNLQRRLASQFENEATTAEQDLDQICRYSQSYDARDQGAMHWVLQSPRFEHWVQSPNPDILLVNGNLEDGTARFSATSLLCGMLVQPLREQKAVHVCHFFCGSHGSRSDGLSGPVGLIRSLIAQIVRLQEFQVDFLRFGNWASSIRTSNVSRLCDLFKRLFEQLPNTIVFCVVDGISHLEDQTGTGDLELVVTTLLETVADGHLSARLKVLFTATSRSRYLSKLLSEDNILYVPTDVGNQRLLSGRLESFELTHERRSPMFASPYNSSYENMYDARFE